MEVISTHVSADFDAFSAMVAAKKIYPQAEIILPSSINSNVRKFIALHEDGLPVLREPGEIDPKSVKKIIMVDTKIPSRLGLLKDVMKNKKPEVIIFDHHQKSNLDIGYGSDFSRAFGAATTILVEIIKKKKIPITPLEATLFSLGIHEDTGSFTYSATTYKDLEAASFLKKQGANLFMISRFLNLSLSGEQHQLLESLICNLKKISIYEKDIILSSAETQKFVEGLSVLTRKLGQIEDVETVFCWVKMKDKIYVVGRSEDVQVDVSRIMEVIGGGGHSQASSAVLKDMSFEDIEHKIRSAIHRNIKKPVQAKDIMSFPIRVVNEDDSVSQVNELLKKYGHTGIPIIDQGNNLVGIITRKDIDKAIKHGLSHAPVKGFRSHGLITAGPNATIDQIQELMIDNGIGRIPIVSKGEVIGIVTRKDVLRSLMGRSYLSYAQNNIQGVEHNISANEIKDRIYTLLPERITQILEIVAGIAREIKIKAYLVGGIVRDLLLGIPNLDIDIVAEGDGIFFARKLSEVLAARLESHEKFGTAVLVLDNKQHIDVASARVEYYEKPAALPHVEPGSIRQDLARRDFTINTLALSLNKSSFGEVLDFFGGRKDLARKKIKVLHKMSFIEDPTRIFRAVRFEQRLGFKMDSQTEKLAISTIELNIVSQLTGIRIRDELISILEESHPWIALKRLFELKALQKIGFDAPIDENFIKFIRRIIERSETLSVHIGRDIITWRLLLTVLLLGKETLLVEKWCEEMKIKNRDGNVIKKTVYQYNILKDPLSERINRNSILYKLLHETTEELKVIISALSKTHFDNVLRYLTKLKHIKLEITGEDLKALKYRPSKGFRIVFDRIIEGKLDGLVKNREEELKLAREVMSQIPQEEIDFA